MSHRDIDELAKELYKEATAANSHQVWDGRRRGRKRIYPRPWTRKPVTNPGTGNVGGQEECT